jgi:hypothetical protein
MLSQRETGGTRQYGGRRQPSSDGTSRMNREIHVRICKRLEVRLLGPTWPRRCRFSRQASEDEVRAADVAGEVDTFSPNPIGLAPIGADVLKIAGKTSPDVGHADIRNRVPITRVTSFPS